MTESSWRYRGHALAPTTALNFIERQLGIAYTSGEEALVKHYLLVGPAKYRAQCGTGQLREEGPTVQVWMAKFLMRLKSIRGVVNDQEEGSEPDEPGAA